MMTGKIFLLFGCFLLFLTLPQPGALAQEECKELTEVSVDVSKELDMQPPKFCVVGKKQDKNFLGVHFQVNFGKPIVSSTALLINSDAAYSLILNADTKGPGLPKIPFFLYPFDTLKGVKTSTFTLVIVTHRAQQKFWFTSCESPDVLLMDFQKLSKDEEKKFTLCARGVSGYPKPKELQIVFRLPEGKNLTDVTLLIQSPIGFAFKDRGKEYLSEPVVEQQQQRLEIAYDFFPNGKVTFLLPSMSLQNFFFYLYPTPPPAQP